VLYVNSDRFGLCINKVYLNQSPKDLEVCVYISTRSGFSGRLMLGSAFASDVATGSGFPSDIASDKCRIVV
jgi:hypothetical protein